MLRRIVRLAAVVILAVGLLCAPPGSGAFAKSKHPQKSSKHESKKGSKKTSKKESKRERREREAKNKKEKGRRGRHSEERVSKHSKKRAERERVASAKSSRHRKSEDDDEEPQRARRTAAPASTAPKATVAKQSVDQFDDDDGSGGDDEPVGPKPANRIVADMSPTRVMQIQTALIGKGLLAGPPNGVYDQSTFQAMAAFQTRNGWSPVGVPTADALKALGVPKNSGRGYMTPGHVVEATAPPQR
jgi:hypothetical protein